MFILLYIFPGTSLPLKQRAQFPKASKIPVWHYHHRKEKCLHLYFLI